MGHRFGCRLGHGPVNCQAGLFQQCLRRVQTQRQIANGLDRVGIVPGIFDATVDPGAALRPDKVNRLVDRRLRDAGIDRDLDDLEDRAVGGRLVVTLVARHEMRLRHLDVVDYDRARQRRALAEARPVVDHRQPGRATVGNRVPGATLVIERHDRHQMRQQRAGRIEFLSIDDHMIAGVGKPCFKIGRALGTEFGKGIAEPRPFQHFRKEQGLLILVGDGTDRRDDAEMVLRDLADRGIGRRDDLDHLGECRIGHLRPAEGLGHVDRPQATLRERVEFGDGPDPLAVALGRILHEFRGQTMGDRDRLGVVLDDVRWRGRPWHRRHCGRGLVGLDVGDGHFMAPSELLGDGMKVRRLSSRRSRLPEIKRADILALSKLGGRSGKDGNAVLENRGVVGIFQRNRRVLLGDQDRQTRLAVELLQRLENVLHDERRQSHGRLVQHQQAGARHQRPADRRHLLLATRGQAGE